MNSDSLFLKEKPVKIILSIRNSRKDIYASKIAKKVDTTYAHAVKTLHRMEEKDLIESKKKGRKKILDLTNKGEKHADILKETHDILHNQDKSHKGISKVIE